MVSFLVCINYTKSVFEHAEERMDLSMLSNAEELYPRKGRGRGGGRERNGRINLRIRERGRGGEGWGERREMTNEREC